VLVFSSPWASPSVLVFSSPWASPSVLAWVLASAEEGLVVVGPGQLALEVVVGVECCPHQP